VAEPLVIRAMRSFKAELLSRETAQLAAMARRWLGVELALESQIQALAEEARRLVDAGETLSAARVWRMQRAQLLLAQTSEQFRLYANYAGGVVTQEQEFLGRLGIEHAVQAIQLSYFPRVDVTFERLPVEAVLNMVGAAGNGGPLGSLLRLRMVRDAKGQPLPDVWNRLVQTLVNNTALGVNPRVTARAMRDDLAGGLQKALVIARTEQMRVYRQVSAEQYVRSGVVTGQKRLTAHDDRVCAACIADEGTVYPVGEPIPDHPQGRCTGVPVVKGVKPVTWLAGEAWFREQGGATQAAILEKGRFAAWKDGAFAFKDLVVPTYDETWGAGLAVAGLGTLASS